MVSPSSMDKSGGPPSAWRVHAALIAAQVAFGVGSIVGKLGVEATNPMLFAMIREVLAGPLLCVIAYFVEGPGLPKRKDWPWFIFAGLCLFFNQAFFIMGFKVASAVLGSAWQPTQPMFVTLISILLGWERFTLLKAAGIALAFAGAAFMVLTDPGEFGKLAFDASSSNWLGNLMFFINCLATALYVIAARVLAKRGYGSAKTVGVSYIFAALFITIITIPLTVTPAGLHFMCPPTEHEVAPGQHNNGSASSMTSNYDCGDHYMTFPNGCECLPWTVPVNTIGPLLYWIAFNSILCYLLITYGSKFATPSNVLGYTALQPVTASLLSVIIITAVGPDTYTALQMPGYNLFGGLIVVGGLLLMVLDGKREAAKQKAIDNAASDLLDHAPLLNPGDGASGRFQWENASPARRERDESGSEYLD